MEEGKDEEGRDGNESVDDRECRWAEEGMDGKRTRKEQEWKEDSD